MFVIYFPRLIGSVPDGTLRIVEGDWLIILKMIAGIPNIRDYLAVDDAVQAWMVNCAKVGNTYHHDRFAVVRTN